MDAIIQGLAQWCYPPNMTTPTNFMAEGWCDQNKIGWDRMLDGWLLEHGAISRAQFNLLDAIGSLARDGSLPYEKQWNMAWDILEH